MSGKTRGTPKKGMLMIARFLQTEDVRKTLRYSLTIVAVFAMFLWTLIVAGAALAHAGPDYCGHSARWITVNGQLHKQEFVREASGPDHIYRGAHFSWTGTGYTRVSGWDTARADNCH
jgi:hypothetical protein